MTKTTIKKIFRETDKYLQSEVEISGWLRTVRGSKDFAFMEINDGSFFKGIQVVISDKLENFNDLSKLNIGSSALVKGKLVESPAKGQDFEIQAQEVEVIQEANEDYPLQKKRHSFEFLRTISHLRSRSNTFSAVFRLRSTLSFAIHKFFQEKNFSYVHTPIISSSDAEGAGEMFEINTLGLDKIPKDDKGNIDYSKEFFAKKVGLTVSGQLNAEALIMGLRDVYTFGPTFRAENSNTPRHASEFWMLEPEMAFYDLKADMDLAQEMIIYLLNYVLESLPEEMEFFNKYIDENLKERLNKIISADFKRITYTEAIDILKKSDKKFEYPVEWGIDLQTEHERYICEEVYNSPVFVSDYPKDIKAFYMRLNDDNKTVAAMDLLVPGVGEIIGGSQREERLDVLKQRMKEMNLSEEDYKWYLDLRRYGSVKHAGFGLGFERLIMYLSGMTNIRDVIPFPRTPKSANF